MLSVNGMTYKKVLGNNIPSQKEWKYDKNHLLHGTTNTRKTKLFQTELQCESSKKLHKINHLF